MLWNRLAEDKFESAKLISKNLVANEDIDTIYTKKYEAYIQFIDDCKL